MTPRVILWDLMDTLVRDPFFTHMPAFFGQSFEALVKALQPGVWVEFELGRVDEDALYTRFFRDGRAVDGPGLKRCVAEAYAWIDGVESLLAELHARGTPMHALSNYPCWYELIEQRLGVSRYVALSFVSCETGFRKPAPEAYLHACQTLGLAPAECLFIDDREQNCVAARALGLSTFLFQGNTDTLRRELTTQGLL